MTGPVYFIMKYFADAKCEISAWGIDEIKTSGFGEMKSPRRSSDFIRVERGFHIAKQYFTRPRGRISLGQCFINIALTAGAVILSKSQAMILRIHTPLFSRYEPTAILNTSMPMQMAYNGRIGRLVNRLST